MFGGGPVKLLQLCKLHGSINWLYSGSAAAADRRSTSAAADALARDKVPLIAPPVFDKSGLSVTRVCWRRGDELNKLKGAGRVIFMGYSLPPTDLLMRWFFQDSCRRRASVVVVDNSLGVRERYETLGLRVRSAGFTGATAVAEFVNWYAADYAV